MGDRSREESIKVLFFVAVLVYFIIHTTKFFIEKLNSRPFNIITALQQVYWILQSTGEMRQWITDRIRNAHILTGRSYNIQVRANVQNGTKTKQRNESVPIQRTHLSLNTDYM